MSVDKILIIGMMAVLVVMNICFGITEFQKNNIIAQAKDPIAASCALKNVRDIACIEYMKKATNNDKN